MRKFSIISLIVAMFLTALLLIFRFCCGSDGGIKASELRITGLKNGIGVECGDTVGGIFVSVPDGYTADDIISVSTDTDIAYLMVKKSEMSDDRTVMAELVGVSEGIAEVYLRIGDTATEKYTVNIIGNGTFSAVTETDIAASDGSVVYITPTGSKYHLKNSCAGKNAVMTELESAVNDGYLPCKICAMVQEKE